MIEAGKTNDLSLPKLYIKHSRSQDPIFLEFLFSIIFVESRFDKHARSQAGAFGLMQITAVAMLDAARTCNLKQLTNLEDLHDSATNIRYGTCFLVSLLEETNYDWDRTLILYNGGYRQLLKYDKTQPIVSETANYVIQVHKARRLCTVPGI